MVLNLFVSIADILSLAFLFVVVNFYTPQHPLMNLSVISQWGIKEHSLLPAALLLIIFICKSFGGYYIYKAQYRFVYRVASRLSGRNLLLYLEGSYEDHVHIDSSVLIRKICHQPIEFANYVLAGIQQITTEAILILLTVIALLIINAKLLAILSLVLLPAIAILRYVAKRRLSVVRKNAKAASEKTLQYLNEALSGFIESNIYDKNEFFSHRYTSFQSVMNTYLADLQITQGMPSRFFEVFAVFGLFVLIVAGEFTGAAKITDLFTLGAFVAAAYKIIPGISRIINLNSQVKTYEYTVNELKKESNNIPSPKKIFYREPLNSIEFKNVCFSYKEHSLISCVNFKMSNGTFIGIRGSSGKGKTTLINLLLGFLSPDAGEILFNAKPVDVAERRAVWSRVAYVKQEPFMVYDSVLKNITLFENDYDLKKISNIIDVTGLKTFTDRFPEGIEKIITEDGKNISGGQRQRIAIARALYKEADVIILDEPFNELDEPSELAMLHYFKQLTEAGKIVILITHNTESFTFCDDVITVTG